MLFRRAAVAAFTKQGGIRSNSLRPVSLDRSHLFAASSLPQWFSTAMEIPPPPTSNHPHKSLPGAKGMIIYTETDEAPALATYSLFPVLSKFGALVGIDLVPCDISVAGRVLALFPEKLKPDQRVPDNLKYLGELVKTPEANIIKLPNISAPLNQLEDCINELRSKGYDVPLYPGDPKNDAEQEVQDKYQSIMGSAVNPVLREGNSDRRVAPPVKAYAQKNPHRMGIWSKASRTHVAHMTQGDFYGSEQSTSVKEDTDVVVEFAPKNGEGKVLKESTPLEKGEVIDASFMSVRQLCNFLEDEIQDAKDAELLFSLHLKATMMKVSDPIMFGSCIRVFFKDAYDKHGKTLEEIGANPNQGLNSIFASVKEKLDTNEAIQILDDFNKCYEDRPWLAMVNSDKGITNLHAPNDSK
jgi:isocitrate dehydrogenase